MLTPGVRWNPNSRNTRYYGWHSRAIAVVDGHVLATHDRFAAGAAVSWVRLKYRYRRDDEQ